MIRRTFAVNKGLWLGLALLASLIQSCTKAELIGVKASQILSAAKLGIAAVTLDSPLAGSYINASTAGAFTVSGSCSLNGQNVILSGDATATVPCSSNTWSAVINVSGKADGLISLTATHSTASTTSNFVKDATPPAAFTIVGVTGTGDLTADAYLLDTNVATVNWNASSDANTFSYDVTIYQNDGSTVQCATRNTSSASTSYAFSACSLSYKQTYKIKVIAKDVAGNQTQATGGLFSFYVNHTPVANSDSIVVAKNASATTINVLANDTDADSDSLTVATVTGSGSASATSVTTSNGGTVTNNGSNVSYTPANGFVGIDSFTYQVSDGHGGTSTGTVTVNVYDPFTWIGGNSTNPHNWSQTGNWCGSIVAGACAGGPAPDNTHTAYFIGGACTGTNCNVTIDAAVDVGGVNIASSYNGTITQGSGHALTVESAGWTQANGAFVGSDANVTIKYALSLSGGSFKSTSSTLTIQPTVPGTIINLASGATFDHNNGTLRFYQTVDYANDHYAVVTAAALNLNNLSFEGAVTHYAHYHFTFSQPVNLAGNLNYSSATCFHQIDSGTINVAGNINAGAGAYGGAGTIVVNGNGAQTFTGTTTDYLPNLVINTTGSFAPSGSTSLGARTINLQQGTFTAPDSTLSIVPVGSGTVLNIASGTVFNHNNGSLRFYPVDDYANESYTITTPAALNLYSLSFEGAVTHYAHYHFTFSQPVNLAGNLNYSSATCFHQIDSGTINVAGNINAGAGAYGGAGTIVVNGNGAQTFTGTTTDYLPNLVINTTGSFAPSGSTHLGAQTLSLQQGTFKAPSGSLTIVPPGPTTILAIASGTIFDHNGGTLRFFPVRDYTNESYSISLPSALNLNSLLFDGAVTHYGDFNYNFNQPINLAGDLTYSSTTCYSHLASGNINVAGNVNAVAGAAGGAGSLTLNGVNQSLSVAAGNTLPTGTFTLASSGTLSLATNVTMNTSGQILNVTSGSIDMAGFNLTLDTLNLNGNTLTKHLGTLTVANGSSPYGGVVNP